MLDTIRDLIYKDETEAALALYRSLDMAQAKGAPVDDLCMQKLYDYLALRGVPCWYMSGFFSNHRNHSDHVTSKSNFATFSDYMHDLMSDFSIRGGEWLYSIESLRSGKCIVFEFKGMDFLGGPDSRLRLSFTSDSIVTITGKAYGRELEGLTYLVAINRMSYCDINSVKKRKFYARILRGLSVLLGDDDFFEEFIENDMIISGEGNFK